MIAKEWEEYRRKCVPPTADDVQVSETRKAFYGGAAALFYGMQRELADGDDIKPADLMMMVNVEVDLQLFTTELKRATGVK